MNAIIHAKRHVCAPSEAWRGSAATHASKFRGCGSTDRVLVMEHMDGTSVGEDAMNRLSQEDRKRDCGEGD